MRSGRRQRFVSAVRAIERGHDLGFFRGPGPRRDLRRHLRPRSRRHHSAAPHGNGRRRLGHARGQVPRPRSRPRLPGVHGQGRRHLRSPEDHRPRNRTLRLRRPRRPRLRGHGQRPQDPTHATHLRRATRRRTTRHQGSQGGKLFFFRRRSGRRSRSGHQRDDERDQHSGGRGGVQGSDGRRPPAEGVASAEPPPSPVGGRVGDFPGVRRG
mmetsp:Transcript_21020/g.67724  ORF Transcript_21020/g.67724 Transcript_21020/m.67724 type:complete len:211 (-) Transcript_21020:996-1628(-)